MCVLCYAVACVLCLDKHRGLGVGGEGGRVESRQIKVWGQPSLMITVITPVIMAITMITEVITAVITLITAVITVITVITPAR